VLAASFVSLLPHQHGVQRASFGARRRFHGCDVGQVGDGALDQLVADVLVRDLATAEGDRELDLVAPFEKRARVLQFEVVVMALDLGPHLDFLELHLVLLLLGLACAPVLLVLELSVVHDAAHGRARGGRNLHQIEPLGLGQQQGFPYRQHPDLLSIVPDHADLGDADALIDADFGLLDCGNDRHLREMRDCTSPGARDAHAKRRAGSPSAETPPGVGAAGARSGPWAGSGREPLSVAGFGDAFLRNRGPRG